MRQINPLILEKIKEIENCPPVFKEFLQKILIAEHNEDVGYASTTINNAYSQLVSKYAQNEEIIKFIGEQK